MTSRLDRLFVLIETGSTTTLRQTAAKQLGEVVKCCPWELNTLLKRLLTYLRHKSWSTRVAAGQAVAAIARNTPTWTPVPIIVVKTEDTGDSGDLGPGFLSLSEFDLSQLLTSGARLYLTNADEMDESDVAEVGREELNRNIGMSGPLGKFMKKDDISLDTMLSNDDMKFFKTDDQSTNCVTSVEEAVKGTLKRKNRSVGAEDRGVVKGNLNGGSKNGSGASEPPQKMRRLSGSQMDETSSEEGPVESPFEWFTTQLLADLWQMNWETRHGAATGLRELMRLHAQGVGRRVGRTREQMEADHVTYLEDIVVRILCTLALDQVSDFVSDEVVAPVRESCAQVLGVLTCHLTYPQILHVVEALLLLSRNASWMIAHGGLLGMKYLLAARQDLGSQLLPIVFSDVLNHLINSQDDDIRAASASALLPVVSILCDPGVMGHLWQVLGSLGELSTATNGIMNLLSALTASPLGRKSFNVTDLEMYVCLLVSFLYHDSTSVREAAVTTLHCLLTQFLDMGHTIPPPILNVLIEQVFQRVVLDPQSSVVQETELLWKTLIEKVSCEELEFACIGRLDVWLCQVTQPSRTPYPDRLLNIPNPRQMKQGSTVGDGEQSSGDAEGDKQLHKKKRAYYIAGPDSLNDTDENREAVVMATRITAVRLLAQLFNKCSASPRKMEGTGHTPFAYIVSTLIISVHLSDTLATCRLVAALLLAEWAKLSGVGRLFSLVIGEAEGEAGRVEVCVQLKAKMLTCLNQFMYYDEILGNFKTMLRDCRSLIGQLTKSKVELDPAYISGSVLTLDQCLALVTTVYDGLTAPKRSSCMSQWVVANSSVQQCSNFLNTLQLRVQTALSAAIVELNWVPDKLNPVIRPIMDSIRREPLPCLQDRAALAVSVLIERCGEREMNPTAKVVKNLCGYLTTGVTECPEIVDDSDVIISLKLHQYSPPLTGRGHKLNKEKTNPTGQSAAESSGTASPVMEAPDPNMVIQRRGAVTAFVDFCRHFGERLETDLSPLWDIVCVQPKAILEAPDTVNDKKEDLLTSLRILEVCLPNMQHSTPTDAVFCPNGPCSRLLDLLLAGPLRHASGRVRHWSACVIATIGMHHPAVVMNEVLEKVLPMVEATTMPSAQMGALEMIYFFVDRLGLSVLPALVLFVVPVMGRMSDTHEEIRTMASRVFAEIIRILPLESSAPDPVGLDERWIAERQQKRVFLDSLLHPKNIVEYALPILIKAELRTYQQEGVNWLAFLNRYRLHGILCDDLGLGKTLQTICVLAGDHYDKCKQFEETSEEDSRPLPSLVICPSTLTGHWLHEVTQFVDRNDLNPMLYAGTPDVRMELQSRYKEHNLLVASYEIVRNDIDFFGSIHWNYVVLDEGHVIKNSKSKLARSVRQLQSNHRLILTGTPIQNRLIELWSLFDFLMPGFLGTEAQFAARYGKPVALSKDAKASSKEQEQGALALESLHRQVLPFMLRRMKEDVLQDLPPKIIQDYQCELTPIQSKLYESFAKSSARREVEAVIDKEEEKGDQKKSQHVFQALQYLRKVCNHPSLALSADHPMCDEVKKMLTSQKRSIKDTDLSGKLIALKQLLLDCGLAGGDTDSFVVSQHRVLIFCQVKAMLDLVEKMLQSQMSDVTYLRLDGSVPAASRHDLVMRFNHDPSIDVLLLTTSVGGLGLNLTGADTVIFVEHDWNPMKDLQAMDRAHRIGQKRVVNVYRLITSGTIEDKIMSLQRFKLSIANTVVTGENRTLETMATDQLFDLFEPPTPGSSQSKSTVSGKRGGLQSVLEGLTDLCEESQYEEEYDLKTFIKKL